MESSDRVALLSPPPTATDFYFDSGCSTPYISAPSSPARIPNFFTSNCQLVDEFYNQFRQLPSFKDAELTLQPGDEKQGIERSSGLAQEADFVFDFGGNGDAYESVFAEELFDGGKIRPLKTELEVRPVKTEINFNKNPKASEELRSSPSLLSSRFTHSSAEDVGAPAPKKTTSRSRSVSIVSETVSFWDMFPFSKQYRNWKLKNLLFRSTSEGRNAVVAISSSVQSNESNAVDTRNDAARFSSSRSNENSGSDSDRKRRRARSVSAHELHYTLNRAASQELKRRTALPYKQGLLGCLGFNNPTDAVSRVGSMTGGESYGSGWS